MTQSTSMEQHPDLMELRARYEAAGETTQAQMLEGMTMVAGLYAAISPWVIGFSATSFQLAMSNLVTGLALTLLALGFASAYSRTHNLSWVVPVIGAWLVITPFFVLDGPLTAGIVLSNVITGGVTVLCGLGIGSLGLMRKGR
ncbi:hypothetical protein FHX42_001910 [Saccharopolyspora lacisalsi]|uniref:SPW repeat-containing integral membrane domain-containing protein n=1 Tax=Halosaccharopolyspora lacisalsi TaxID=1000566 RepID=A0A839DU43_9PSEU|nr:SPW repeat protein [Halosaccharopolyspora lacisalsi]MBA8824563.1 hypothetical protein [Halosaccharopolyspora lacisalsi]